MARDRDERPTIASVFSDVWFWGIFAVASILHYWHIFTFHREHYWSLILAGLVIESLIEGIESYRRKRK